MGGGNFDELNVRSNGLDEPGGIETDDAVGCCADVEEGDGAGL